MSTVNIGNVNEFNVQQVIAQLLVEFSGDTARERLVEESRFAKQSLDETAFRTAGNLLRSSVTRKPAGTVPIF